MRKTYLGTQFEWIDEDHRQGKSRAYRLFSHGAIRVGKREVRVTPRHIEIWLKKNLIKEVE